MIGTPAGEQHALPLAILADLLRDAHLQVVDLGADTPAESFVDTARGIDRLDVVAIGVTTPELEVAVADTVSALRRAGLHVPILVGGAAIADEDAARRSGADGWSGRAGEHAVRAIGERVLSRSRRGASPA